MNQTEVKRIPFDLERAKKGDKIISDGDIGEWMFSNKNSGLTYHLFQFSRGGDEESIISYNENTDKWVHGFNGAPYKLEVSMAPVEKTGWIAIYKSSNIDNRLALVTNAYPTEGECIEAASTFFDFSSIICTKQITWEE